jgi:gliding motility-associated lipoprotein GldH
MILSRNNINRITFRRSFTLLHHSSFANWCLLLFSCLLLPASCKKIDLYEKIVSIPKHSWQSSFKPQFAFDIKDTTVPYQLFLILRHNEKYNYNNIWLNLYTKAPDSSQVSKARYEITLATSEKGWLGSGMDDIYEHRVALTPASEKFYFKKSGLYTFTLEQIMREDPLENVMDAGLRLEKKLP